MVYIMRCCTLTWRKDAGPGTVDATGHLHPRSVRSISCLKKGRGGGRVLSPYQGPGGDSDAWVSIDSSTECIPPTPSQLLSPYQVMIFDGLFSQIGDTGELLGDQQLSLTPIPAIEINPKVHSFEGFSPEQGDVITPVQHNRRKMPQNNNPTNPTITLVEPSMEDEAKNKKF
ncbi:hypothetical protein FHG87_020344 [Trinorchestia longiramus]|nr:hypothetical protein FHG87_020344 [Trinorchestia longiramus]